MTLTSIRGGLADLMALDGRRRECERCRIDHAWMRAITRWPDGRAACLIEGMKPRRTKAHWRSASGLMLDAMPDPATTRARIRSEWAVAERADQPFAVVSFEIVDPRIDPRPVMRLLRALQPRLLAGAEIGRLDGGRLAMLLPLCGGKDARATGTAVARELSRCGQSAPFTVHAFEPATGNNHSSRTPAAAGVGPTSSPTSMSLALLAVDPLPSWKRLVDVFAAAIALIVLSPVLLVAALLVKVSSPGPILFRQQRAGWSGVPFTIYKFRTMVDGADALKERLRAFNERSGPVFKMTHDPRITRLGRLLRVTSIDELPQLWNVMKGDMSLVGPRPPSLDELPFYESWQRHRLDVKPGITCLWQVEARGGVEFAEWVRMDLRYIRQRSLLYDLSLMARTVPAVVSRRGAS